MLTLLLGGCPARARPTAVGSTRPAANSFRRPNRMLGLSGIASIRKPSASSTAEAITADTGITPASPAPLMPNGFSGEGVS
jgi:hypothetical protein